MRVCSLFSGIGGIDLAFEQAGHEIVWANDIDKYACMTYRHNFPNVNLVEADIRSVDKSSIPDCDIVAAGFPCQPFSVCGKQKGFNDERGNLFFEVGKVIDTKQPKIVFLENVANLTNEQYLAIINSPRMKQIEMEVKYKEKDPIKYWEYFKNNEVLI